MATLKAALFDLDGTLIDTEKAYETFWRGIGQKYCPWEKDIMKHVRGTTLTKTLEFFEGEQTKKEVAQAMADFEANELPYTFFPGVKEYLNELRMAGVKLAVVTSSNTKKMRAVYNKLPEITTMFDGILTAEDFKASKPDPDCYNRGAEYFGCQKNECIVFEDALSGLQAGKSSGIFTVGLTTSYPSDVIKDLCDITIDGFESLTVSQTRSWIINR